MQVEIEMGQNIIDCAKECKVNFVVFSSTENISKLTENKLKCRFTDGKGKVEEYLANSGVNNWCVVRYATYYTSIERNVHGNNLFLPCSGSQRIYTVDTDSACEAVINILRNPTSFATKVEGLATDYQPAGEYARLMSIKKHRLIHFQQFTLEDYKAKYPNKPFLEDFVAFYRFMSEYPTLYMRNVENTFKLSPQARTFLEWCRNKVSPMAHATYSGAGDMEQQQFADEGEESRGGVEEKEGSERKRGGNNTLPMLGEAAADVLRIKARGTGDKGGGGVIGKLQEKNTFTSTPATASQQQEQKQIEQSTEKGSTSESIQQAQIQQEEGKA